MLNTCDGTFRKEGASGDPMETSVDGLRVRFEVYPAYITALCEGSYNFSDAVRIFEEACRTAFARRLPGVLFDFRNVSGTLTATQRFELGERTADLYFKEPYTHIRRIALIGYEPLIDPNRLGELVAQNRGMPVKVCTDMQEALNWLDISLTRDQVV